MLYSRGVSSRKGLCGPYMRAVLRRYGVRHEDAGHIIVAESLEGADLCFQIFVGLEDEDVVARFLEHRLGAADAVAEEFPVDAGNHYAHDVRAALAEVGGNDVGTIAH